MPSLTIRIADAMRISGYVADEKDKRAKSAKERIVQALARVADAPIETPPLPMESTNASIWLSAPECKQLIAYGQKFLLSEGEAASALLIADFEHWKLANTPQPTVIADEQKSRLTRMRSRLATAGIKPRKEQEQLYESFEALDGGTDRRVLVAESGTGTGKTLAYLTLALDWIEDNPLARVYVATPTLALMAQTRKELALLLSQHPSKKGSTSGNRSQIAYLSGQSEWVSEVALEDLLSAASDDDRLSDQDIAQLRDLMARWSTNPPYDPDLPPWSVASLIAAAPGFAWIDDVTLRSEAATSAGNTLGTDSGAKAYRAQFARLESSQLIVMTHAMFAQLTKRRYFSELRSAKGNPDMQTAVAQWRETPQSLREAKLYEVLNAALGEAADDGGKQILPNADLLIIDEAHAFRETFATAFETFVSLNSVLRAARRLNAEHPSVLPRDSISALNGVMKEIHGITRSGADIVDLHDMPGLILKLADAVQLAVEAKPATSKSKQALIRQSQSGRLLTSTARSLRLYAESMTRSNTVKAFLHWSPRREFPRLTMGSQFLNRELSYIWTNVAHRTLLISGTLYEDIPLPSCEGVRQSLSIPMELVRTMQPIHAAWQIDPVTLYSVADVRELDGRQKFSRPLSKHRKDDSDDVAHQLWLDDVAQYVHRVQASAKGGVLVVGTAFQDLEGLHSRLGKAPAQTMLLHQRGATLAGLRQSFLEKSMHQPVTLLASGAAWTGFDLFDPQNPDALTDLVILNTPFGLNTGSVTSMIQRLDNRGHFAASSHALILVRQVVGRLVRSPDTPANRRIHWLDARIHNPEWRGLTASIRRFLSRYKQVNVS